MRVSSRENHRWVVQDIRLESVRLAKSLAAEHGVRIRTILEMALEHFVETSEGLVNDILEWEENHE